MFPVSLIDKPLCLICIHYNLVLGSIINSIVRKPVVSKFELRISRPLPHVYHLSRHAQLVSFYVNHIGKYICQAAHMHRLVRTYLVRIFPRKGLSTWCKTNLFFFLFQKDIPDERNALNPTDNTPCQKLATKIKAFQSVFEVKDLAANGTCRQVTLLT